LIGLIQSRGMHGWVWIKTGMKSEPLNVHWFRSIVYNCIIKLHA